MMRFVVAVLIAAWTAPAAAQSNLAAQPYWKLMEGWWRAENTYMDGDLNYNIRSYNALIHVELDGRTYRETEYKFYAPSKLAQTYGRGQTTAEEGIETVSVITGELVDDLGTVKLTGSRPPGLGDEGTVMKVLSPDTGVRVTANPKTGTDTYRMFIFAPTSDKRYRSNFGLVSDTQGSGAANALAGAKMGDLRGFSLFREDRIAASDMERWRAEFRTRNKVAAIVEPGADGKAVVRRLK
jgi:hypothetical protein